LSKLDSPFFARKARGRFGKDLVYSSWRGIPYVKVFYPASQKDSPRQRVVQASFSRLTKGWAGLSEAQREAWRAYAGRQKVPNSAHCLFLSFAVRAEDAGLPLPVLPPLGQAPHAPYLSVTPGEEPRSVAVSWSFPRSQKVPEGAILDLWSCLTLPSRQAYQRQFTHLVYVPAPVGRAAINKLPAKRRPHFRARLILPDSRASAFSKTASRDEP
jgi:hypothetical protein